MLGAHVLDGDRQQSPEEVHGTLPQQQKIPVLFLPTHLPLPSLYGNPKPSLDAGSMQGWAVVLCCGTLEHLLLHKPAQEPSQTWAAALAHQSSGHSHSFPAKTLSQLRAATGAHGPEHPGLWT